MNCKKTLASILTTTSLLLSAYAVTDAPTYSKMPAYDESEYIKKRDSRRTDLDILLYTLDLTECLSSKERFNINASLEDLYLKSIVLKRNFNEFDEEFEIYKTQIMFVYGIPLEKKSRLDSFQRYLEERKDKLSPSHYALHMINMGIVKLESDCNTPDMSPLYSDLNRHIKEDTIQLYIDDVKLFSNDQLRIIDGKILNSFDNGNKSVVFTVVNLDEFGVKGKPFYRIDIIKYNDDTNIQSWEKIKSTTRKKL